MPNDIRHEGAGAWLSNVQPNAPAERQGARRWCAGQALAHDDPQQALRDLLDQIGLNPADGETR